MRRFAVILFVLLLPIPVMADDCPVGTWRLAPDVEPTNYTYDATNMTWNVTASYGNLSGIGVCNETTAPDWISTDTDFQTGTTGPYCWCKITSPVQSSWVYLRYSGSSANCASGCMGDCGYIAYINADFRTVMFNSTSCQSCTGLPTNAHWTSNGTTATNCAWQCDAGYYLSNGVCTGCGSGYYCPGDNIQYECPKTNTDYYAKYGYHPLWDFTSSGEAVGEGCWTAAGELNVNEYFCRSRIYFSDDAGNVFINEGFWNGTDYWNGLVLWSIAGNGYYLYDYMGHSYTTWYRGVKPCTNAPSNAHYTGPGTPDSTDGTIVDSNDCPWACDDGYGQHGGSCLPLCSAGFTKLKTGTGLSFNVYANRTSTPAINVGFNNLVCYVNLESGRGNMNVDFNGTIYHATD